MLNESTASKNCEHFFAHTYRALKPATPKELHCLLATLTDKSHVNEELAKFRITQSSRLVVVTLPAKEALQNVSLKTNSFELLRTSAVRPYSFEKDDYVTIQGDFSYSVHRTGTNRKECPVDGRGLIKPAFKRSFLAYLTKATGVDCEQAAEAGMLGFAWENRSSPQDKVWLNDVITIHLTGPVVIPEVTNALAYTAIGRRRSYGLGSLQVFAIEP